MIKSSWLAHLLHQMLFIYRVQNIQELDFYPYWNELRYIIWYCVMYLKRKYIFCLIEDLCLYPWIPQSLHPLTFCNQHSILFLWSQFSQSLHLKGNIHLSFCVLAFLFSDSIHVIMNDNLSLFKDRIVFHCVFIYHIFFTCPLAGDGLVDFRTRLSWTMLQGPQDCSCLFSVIMLTLLDHCPEVGLLDLLLIPFFEAPPQSFP